MPLSKVIRDWAAPSVRIERTWFDGGGCTLTVNHKKRTELRTICVTGSRSGRTTRFLGCGVIMTRQVYPSLSGNTCTDEVAVRVKHR